MENTLVIFYGGKPGKYCFEKKKWVFIPGLSNSNISFDLRLLDALSKYKINNAVK